MSFRGVLSYLSRIPGPAESPRQLARGLGWFTISGVVTGTLAGLAGLLLFAFVTPLVAAFLTVVAYYLIKGILHLDGLADVADGLAAHGPLATRWKAMRDPRIGAAGAFVLALVPLGIVVSLVSMNAPPPWFPQFSGVSYSVPLLTRAWGDHPVPWDVLIVLILAELNGNGAMIFAMAGATPVPGSRHAAPLVLAATPGIVLQAALDCVVLSVVLGGFLVIATFWAVLVAAGFSTLAHRSLGGVGGDVLGAVQQVTFVGVLVLAVVLPWRPPL